MRLELFKRQRPRSAQSPDDFRTIGRPRPWRADLGRDIALFVALLVVTTIVVWPVKHSGYSADDIFDSQIPMRLRADGESPWHFFVRVNRVWRDQEGRWFPGSVALGTLVFTQLDSLKVYKSFQILAVLAAVTAFCTFVAVLTRNRRVGILAGLLVVACFQIRVQYDPILQFAMQQPVLSIYLFTSFSAAIVFLRKQSAGWLALAVVTYAISLVTYETTFLLAPAFLVFAVLDRVRERDGAVRRGARLVGAIAVPVLINGIYVANLRGKVQNPNPIYVSNFEFGPLTRTFAKQFSGALPLSYGELEPPPYVERFPASLDLERFTGIVTVALVVALAVALLWRPLKIATAEALTLLCIGAAFWVVPALVVAQTSRWQNEIVVGNPYIPVFQEYFGVVLCLLGSAALLANLLHSRSLSLPASARLPLVVVAAIAIAAVVQSTSANNRSSVAYYDGSTLSPRRTFEKAIQRGVFDLVSDRTTVYTPDFGRWFNAPFIAWWGGPDTTMLAGRPGEEPTKLCPNRTTPCDGTALPTIGLAATGFMPGQPRIIVVGSLLELSWPIDGPPSMRADRADVYIDVPHSFVSTHDDANMCDSWLTDHPVPMTGADGTAATVAPIDTSLLDHGSDWCLFRLTPTAGTIDLNNILT